MPTAAATLAFQTNPVIAVSPVVFQVPGRHVDLQVKVTAPLAGNNLPILILSHGHGRSNFLSSMRGYTPLVDYYAANGFVVIQAASQYGVHQEPDPRLPAAAPTSRCLASALVARGMKPG